MLDSAVASLSSATFHDTNRSYPKMNVTINDNRIISALCKIIERDLGHTRYNIILIEEVFSFASPAFVDHKLLQEDISQTVVAAYGVDNYLILNPFK